MQQGAWARVTGVLPTVTYPSHTTLITGVLPAVHGILDNRIFDPEGLSQQAWYWYASAIKVPTLPGAVKARGLTAAGVSWPASVGMELDYNVPRSSGRATRRTCDSDVSTVMAAAPHRVLCVFDRETAGVAPDGRRSRRSGSMAGQARFIQIS